MTSATHLFSQVQWAPTPMQLNPGLALFNAHQEIHEPEVAFKLPNQQNAPLLNLLQSSYVLSSAEKQAELSPLNLEESYYTNMYQQLANRYNPQYKNKKPVHVAINQRTVNGLLSLLLLFVISVCGSTGAVLIISSLTVIESLQTRNNCYLVSLALTNLFVTLLVIPTSAIQIMTGDSLDGQKLCHYQWLLLENSLIVSQLSFFLMAADNYLAYQCSHKVTIAASSVGSSNKLDQNFCNLLVSDDLVPKSTLTPNTDRTHHQQLISAPSDTDSLLNNNTDLLWRLNGKAEVNRSSLLGYRFCCGRLKVPVWIICTWLISVTCTVYQHESRYGPEFCSYPTTPSQHPNISNLNHTAARGPTGQPSSEPLMSSQVSQEVQTLEGRVVPSRAERSTALRTEGHYFVNHLGPTTKTGSLSFKSKSKSRASSIPVVETVHTLNGLGEEHLLSGEREDNWHEVMNIYPVEKQEKGFSLETVHDSCHRNKCRPDAASRTSRHIVQLVGSGVEGEKTSIRSLQRVPYKQLPSEIQLIKRVDESVGKLEAIRWAGAPDYPHKSVRHTWFSWFNAPKKSFGHRKVAQSHSQRNSERDLNELFMNNNNSNDDNNVAPMQIGPKQRSVRAPMYIGPTDYATSSNLATHFSEPLNHPQHSTTTRLRQINKNHQVDQQVLAKWRSPPGTSPPTVTSIAPIKQSQFVDNSIGGTQLNISSAFTTSGPSKDSQQPRSDQWLMVLIISSFSSFFSMLFFAGAYLKMKEFKMRPYKPMPVDAMNAFVASLVSRSGNDGSPFPSSPSQLTPEMTPLKHQHWPPQINTIRPTSALLPLDHAQAAPTSYLNLRSVSQPCGSTQCVREKFQVEPNILSWKQQQHRQLNQALSAPGGAVICPNTYLLQPTTQQQSHHKNRPLHRHSFRQHTTPIEQSVLVANEQVGFQKAPVSAPKSLLISHEDPPALERHRSLPPQSRSTSLSPRQDKKLDPRNTTVQSQHAKAIKPHANQFPVPDETNNNRGLLPRNAASLSCARSEPEASVSCSSKEAVVGKHYNRAIICTYSYMTDEQLLKSNIIAFVVNLTLWLPLILLTVVIEPRQPHHNPSQELKDFVWWMATLNCCCCSYVYALTNKDFREAFNKLFYYCCCKSHVTFQKKTPIFRRQLDLDPKCNLRVHIIPGLNQFSSKLSRP